MSAFIRRYLFDPGTEVLLEIESVNILDLEPPAAITGVGSNVAMVVGEFEDGPYKVANEMGGGGDLVATYGELGYRRAGVPGFYPSAISRKADGVTDAEAWNGNGFVQLQGKRFARLVICRVDTSCGSVRFSRRAFITGASAFGYNLEPAQSVTFIKGDGTSATAVFDAAAAVYTSAAGTGYPSGFVGGETLILGYDDKPDQTVTFAAGDQTQPQVMDRINAKMGFAFATQGSSTTTVFTGVRRGKQGEVRIVGGTAGVLTKMGLTANTVLGTGDVADIDSVKFDEIKATVETDVNWIKVEQDAGANLRFSVVPSDSDDALTVGAVTATALGLVAGQHATLDGSARLVSAVGAYPTTFAGGETLSVQIDGKTPQTITFASSDTSQVLAIAKMNSVLGAGIVEAVGSTRIRITGVANGGSVRIVAGTPLVLTKLGLAVGTITALPNVGALLPAGTLLSESTGTRLLVTSQSYSVPARATGPFEVPVRHAIDDGTGLQFNAGAVTTVSDVISGGSFAVTNLFVITPALTEGQIDAKYQEAFNATLSANNIAASVSVCWSARQSNACRRMVRDNVLRASASGLQGRFGVVRPPLNTPKAVAKSRVAEPGVGATADQRVAYTYPGFSLVIPQIALRGSAGGFGFSQDGMTDVGSDGFLVSILSQLPPEEDPGQQTEFLSQVSDLERGVNISGTALEIGDYTAFKQVGICAPRFDGGVATFQSGVTSVDPSVQTSLVSIQRRRMADFIEDTLARRLKNFGKKLSTVARRRVIAGEIRNFLDGLLSKNDDSKQRIYGYTLDTKTGNTVQLLQAGLFRIIVKVRVLPSLKSFALACTIGEQVEVEEFIPALAA